MKLEVFDKEVYLDESLVDASEEEIRSRLTGIFQANEKVLNRIFLFRETLPARS